MRLFQIAVLVLAGLAATGCAEAMRNAQLEKVARDWALTIRASQVIPVYPLTEDLVPGDVFLVTVPISDQAAQYKERGFLPLDQHLVRLEQIEYATFYGGSYGIGKNRDTPSHWRFPGSGKEEDGWPMAPRVAFPTYSFEVSSGVGLNLAIPIEGVPIALSLMHTDSAAGTVAISEAHAFGVSLHEIKPSLDRWAALPENRAMLRAVKEANPHAVYVRVVSRVYVAKHVSVGLVNKRGFSSEIKAGAAVEDAQAGIDAANVLNKAATPLPIRGALKFGFATERSVIMEETFPRPLVIGYLGFDFEILKGGDLGSPVVTQQSLTGKDQKSQALGEFSSGQQLLSVLLDACGTLPEVRQHAIYLEACARIGGALKDRYIERRKEYEPRRAFGLARADAEAKQNGHPTADEVHEVLLPLYLKK